MTRIKELETKILKARSDYYNHQPTISDKAFDAIVDELKQLDPKNIAVTSVGAPIAPSEWKKAKHNIPMGSLDKVNSPTELIDWAKSYGPFLTIDKLDGISIEAVYENGKFIQATTRGDGLIGENIGVNVIKMGGVKKHLSVNFTGSLRGEIVLTKSNHKKYFSDKANPRNAASGVSKRLDGVGVEYLDVMFYQALGDVDFNTEQEQLKWLKSQGLNTPNFWLHKSVKEINDFWRSYQDNDRNKLDYDIDGLVCRINDLTIQTSLGETNMRPKGAVAFKFDNQALESVIRSIDFQTGSMGRITPVATVDPIILAGATVTRASIYNPSYIQELKLDVGARVLVERANDVIPKITELVKGTGTVIKIPTKCPECNHPTKMDGENLMCTNKTDCPAQVKGRISNWINELNILEFGGALIDRLIESGKVKTIADLYKLTVADMANLERMGEKSAQKCYDLLWAGSDVSLDIFLGGLSIPMIGSSTIRLIINQGHDTLEKIQDLTVSNLENISGLGPARAQSLVDGLITNEKLIEELLELGVTIKQRTVGRLTTKSICFSGAMVNKRPVLEKMASDAGADVKSSVGKGLSYLVLADTSSTSGKATSAKKLGTKIISEDDFLKMVK